MYTIDQRILGKFPDGGEIDCSHPLVCHCQDTASVVMWLWCNWLSDTTKKMLCDAFQLDEMSTCFWLCFWAACHDIGKCTPAFVKKLRELDPQLYEELRRDGYRFIGEKVSYHNTLGATIFKKLLLETNPELDQDFVNNAAAVISGHHGVINIPDSWSVNLGHFEQGPQNWINQQRLLFQHFYSQYKIGELASPKNPVQGDVYYLVLKLITIADWISSGLFNRKPHGVDLTTYLAESFHVAETVMPDTGFIPMRLKIDNFSYQDIFKFSPNPMQDACLNIANQMTEPTLTLIEYPPGEGKTEGASAIVYGGMKNLKCDGFYYALPTRATANSMFKRVADFSNKMFENVNAHLSHGYAKQNEFYEKLLCNIKDVGKDYSDKALAYRWFAFPKRKLLAPIAVGTIDQLELGALRTKHFYMRLMFNKVVVLDEVHAYDTYMSTICKDAIRHYGTMDCPVVLMSATLTNKKRKELVQSYCGKKVALPDVPYPRITTVTKTGKVDVVPLEVEHSKKVRIKLTPKNKHAILERLKKQLKKGGVAAVMVNTIRFSQKLARFIEEAMPEWKIISINAKFPVGWKENIENEILQCAGKESWDADGHRKTKVPIVVVGTQIIEQSLDVDFDFVMSELAPVDLLLQRMGRLWRHRNKFRFLKQAEFDIICDKAPYGMVPDIQDSRPYDKFLMLMSYLLFVKGKRKTVSAPQDFDELIESGYSDVIPVMNKKWTAVLVEAKLKLLEREQIHTRSAHNQLIPKQIFGQISDFFEQDFSFLDDNDMLDITGESVEWMTDSDDECEYYSQEAWTRLVKRNVNIIFLREVDGKIMLLDEDTQLTLNQEPDLELARKIHACGISVTYPSKVVDCFYENGKLKDGPIGWVKNPLLWKCRCILLDKNYTSEINGYKLTLSRKYGLEYEKIDEII